MCSTSTFPCIMTMVPNLIFIFGIIIFNFFLKNMKKRFFAFWYDFCCSFFVNDFIIFFLNLIISTACFLKNLQNFFLRSLLLYTSYLFSMLLNDYIVDIEKPDGIFSPTFVVDEFLGLFLHPSIFSIKHLRSG